MTTSTIFLVIFKINQPNIYHQDATAFTADPIFKMPDINRILYELNFLLTLRKSFKTENKLQNRQQQLQN